LELKQKYKNLRAFVVLLAALISWILNMRYQRALVKALVIELIVIVVFYVVSSVAIRLIDRIKNMEVKTGIKDFEVNDAAAENEEASDENAAE
jgi:glucan phosphoethanolaminetransferase (alkaline phosphatase superfamily)